MKNKVGGWVGPKSAGMALVELLLVFAVLIALSAAVFTIYKMTQPKAVSVSEAQRLLVIATNLRTLYGIQTSFTGLTTGGANQARVFPYSMNEGNYAASAPIHSSSGGSVEVRPYVDPYRFSIVYADMPAEECLRLVPDAAPRFAKVMVGTTSVRDVTESGNEPVILDLESIVEACNGQPSVSIEWISY